MRIECDSSDDFLINLKTSEVVGGVVYVNRVRRSCDPRQTLRDATSIEVGIQLSAIIGFGDGEALLQSGETCGIDRLTADGDVDGTRNFDRIVQSVYDYCNSAGLKIRPGAIGL